MEKLVEAIKICYRHCWGELSDNDLQGVYELCRQEGINLAGCESSNELVKRIFSFLKAKKYGSFEQKLKGDQEDANVLSLNSYRKKKYQVVLDQLMDQTKIDLVLYNLLARELLNFRYNRLKNVPLTQMINEEEACSEEVLFIGIIGSLCKQYFSLGINQGIEKYPHGDLIKEHLFNDCKGGQN